MKTIKIKNQSIKGYEYNDLSDDAKEKVLDYFRQDNEYSWGDDAIKSLEGFMEHFGAKLTNYSIDWLEKYRSEIKIDTYDIEYSEKELKNLIKSMGSYDPKTLRGHGECKFTGYCMDESACDGARKAYFNGERDLYEILYAGYESWYADCNKDYEYTFTEEYITENIDMNDYLFDENGKLLPITYYTKDNKIVKAAYNELEIEIQ